MEHDLKTWCNQFFIISSCAVCSASHVVALALMPAPVPEADPSGSMSIKFLTKLESWISTNASARRYRAPAVKYPEFASNRQPRKETGHFSIKSAGGCAAKTNPQEKQKRNRKEQNGDIME